MDIKKIRLAFFISLGFVVFSIISMPGLQAASIFLLIISVPIAALTGIVWILKLFKEKEWKVAGNIVAAFALFFVGWFTSFMIAETSKDQLIHHQYIQLIFLCSFAAIIYLVVYLIKNLYPKS